MNENNRLIIFFAVIATVIGVILLIAFWPEKDTTFICGVKADGAYEKIGKVDYKKYKCLIQSESKVPLVVVQNLSTSEKENLNEAAKKANHAIYYLNTKEISQPDLKDIKKSLDYNDSSFKKPVILTIQKSKVIEYSEDIINISNKIYEFLKEANLVLYICGVSRDPNNENLGTVTYEQYKCLYESNDVFVLVVSQTNCGYCTSYKPIISKYAKKNDLPVYVLEFNLLSSENIDEFLSSYSYFSENSRWGTPLTLGIKNKEIVDYIGGFTENESEINDFFKAIGLK